jgi:outer membrane usher protein
MSRAPASSRTLISRRIFLNLALLFAPIAPLQAQVADAGLQELVVELRINEQDSQEMLVVLRDAAGNFWIDSADLTRLRLRAPVGASLEHEGQRFVPIAAYTGAEVRFDEPLGMLFLQLPANAFLPIRISAPEQLSEGPQAAANGLFLNYQVYGQRVSRINAAGAFTELGVFSRLGVATSTLAMRRDQDQTRATRLDTALSRDFPQRLQTLTIGDAVTDPGSFGAALRFAGVRLEKNFSIRPDLVTAPLLLASGTAVVPSAVDVFVNNQRVLTEQVQPGPFVIDNLPTVSGAGDVRVVVRDATGREQVLTQAFYSSPQLLSQGLNQYSVSMGRVRENYGLHNFDYGPWTGSATWRRGVNDAFTLEGHAEYLQGETYGAGMELVARAGHLGVASFTAAAGGGESSHGWLTGLGFERQAERASMALGLTWASSGFRRAGEPDFASQRQKIRGQLQVGFNLGKLGSTTLAVAQLVAQDDSRQRTVSVMHSMRAARQGFFNLSVNHSVSERRATSAFLTYTQAWGANRTFSASAEGGDRFAAVRDELRASLAQSSPVGEGHGWRVSATRSGNYDGWWQQRFAAADLELQASRNYNQNGQSLQLRGGISLLDGQLHRARSVDGSFAVINVGDIADVPVYLENRLVTRTDARGRAVLPNLLSYEANRISVEPEDLPLNTQINARAMVVRPAYRSGVVVQFPVVRISPAVFRLLLPDNSPVPVGAEVQLNGGTFAVAMDGYTYVTTLDHGTGGTAAWEGGRCVFRVEPPPSDDPLPDMGDIICRPVQGAAR